MSGERPSYRNDGMNQRGGGKSPSLSGRTAHPRKYSLPFACVSLNISSPIREGKGVRVSWRAGGVGGGGHSQRASLPPRVYLQTVTLMQCNDYFYSRYLGGPFTLSGMAPRWPPDYLCGCCHTCPHPPLLLHRRLFTRPSVRF